TEAAVEILRSVGSAAPEVSADRRSISVTVAHGPAALSAVLEQVELRDIRLHDAGMQRPTLDDVFLQLTGHAAAPGTSDDEDGPASAKKGRRRRGARETDDLEKDNLENAR
ncbi:MAG: hypothetical protein H7146_13160, partial [Burkholderiaceae bacterium]|nr:hypothetical protein [Microbacteriaceae bacterium]